MAVQDQVKIDSIDQSTMTNGYVLINVEITVSDVVYQQQFTVNAVDPVSVASSVQQQAETFRQQVLSTANIVTDPTDLMTLDGTVIAL